MSATILSPTVINGTLPNSAKPNFVNSSSFTFYLDTVLQCVCVNPPTMLNKPAEVWVQLSTDNATWVNVDRRAFSYGPSITSRQIFELGNYAGNNASGFATGYDNIQAWAFYRLLFGGNLGGNVTVSAFGDSGALSGGGSIPSTGLVITQHSGLIQTDTPSGGAVTCDFSVSDKHAVTLAANTTFTFSNPTTAQIVTLDVIQGGSGSNTATWPGTVDWGSAGAPTLTTTTGDTDIFVFYWNGTKYRAGTFGTGY